MIKTMYLKISFSLLFLLVIGACAQKESWPAHEVESNNRFEPPVFYNKARKKAESIVMLRSADEKIEIIGGHDIFFTKGYEKNGIPAIRFSDATQGISLIDYTYHLEKLVAFLAPIMLASTWNTDLSYKYAESIGGKARAGGIIILLGPGLNIYRISQSQYGRNFEYFGEDPYWYLEWSRIM